MMSKKGPQLRFEGFTDDWEERKLKDVLYISKARNKSHKYGKEDVLSVSREVGTVNQIEYQGRSFAGSDISNYKVVQGGELIYTKSPLKGAPYGIFQVATLEGILSPLYAVYNSTDKAYTPFVAMALKTDSIATHYLSPLVAKGAKNTINVTDEEALQGKIKFPNILEQKQIFIFFKQLDHTIALHQRKLDLLKEQKKGYLQKMFPKNGAKVPELRFAGFADDWEERKLGDHAKYRRGSFPQPYGNKEWYDGEGAMPFVQVVDVTNKLTLVENTKQKISKLAQSKSVFVPKGKVVVTLQGSIGRVAITQYDSFVDRTLLIFEDYEKETDERFWAYTIQKKFEIEKLKAPGGTIKTITKEALSSFDVHLPKFEEQQKIGSFFKQLDDTIALHQRKLDLLKEQKKGFLQKMFV